MPQGLTPATAPCCGKAAGQRGAVAGALYHLFHRQRADNLT